MNENDKKLIKELIKELIIECKDEFPKSLLLLLIFLTIGMVGAGISFFKVLEVRKELKMAEKLLIGLGIVAVLCLLGIVAICLWNSIKKTHNDKKKRNEQSGSYDTEEQNKNVLATSEKYELGQKVIAHIIEQGNYQGNLDRDQKFIDINRSVTKTYSVLGTALTSLSEKESMLKKMAANGVKIRLCTMDPRMTVDDICIREIENRSCYFMENWEKGVRGDAKTEDASQILEKIKNGTLSCQKDHLLNLMHMLIEKEHMKEYYATSLDYQNRIQTARHNLDIIQEKIVEKYGKDAMEIRDADSFIPISMTVTDEKEDKGEMIVEFHLPFTDNKIMFFVNRKENDELFQTFMDFYKTVWRRAGNE